MSDKQLIRERFWQFFKQNASRLKSFAESQATHDYPAEDLLQDAFLCAWDHLDPDNCDNWSAWLHQIIVCRRIDRHRRRNRAPVVLAGDITMVEDSDIIASTACKEPSPTELAENSDDEQIVRQAVAKMKNKQQRRVLELLLRDRTLQQVATALNISHVNAKKIYQRGRDALRETSSIRQLANETNLLTERQNHEP